MPATWSTIRYRDFWDLPRVFIAQHRGKWFLFDCAFDEELEDYPDRYKVSVITPPSDEELAGSWKELTQRAVQFLGDVPTAKVAFDPTKRHAIDSAVLEELTATASVT